MSSAVDPSLYSAIWLELVKFQRKARLMAVLQEDRPKELLNYTEGLILHILEERPGCNVKELAELLHLERSWVSRIVSSLQQAKYLKAFVPESDKRSKKLRLSGSAKEALERLNAFRSGIMENLLSALNQSEKEELYALYKSLADGLLAPSHLAIRGAHPFDNEMARASWAVGVLGNDFMHSGLNVTQYQILYALSTSGKGLIFAVDLFEILPFDMSTISRVLAGFSGDGIVEKRKLLRDKRAMALRLSDKGQALWQKCLRIADATIGQALREMPETKSKKLLELLRRASGEALRRPSSQLQSRIQVMEAESGDLGEAAQSFLERRIPPDKSGWKSSRSVRPERRVLLVNGEIKGVADVAGGSRERAGRLFIFSADAEKEACFEFLKSCLGTSAESKYTNNK